MSDECVVPFSVSVAEVFLANSNEVLDESIFLLHLVKFHVIISKYFLLLIDVTLHNLVLKCLLPLLYFFESISIIRNMIWILSNLFILFP